MGYALPEDVWTSERVEDALSAVYERLHLPKGRLELMTGIRERRHWKPHFEPSKASALAGEAVLKKSSFERASMDLLVHAAVCRDHLEPATASYVHRLLGLSGKTQIFDLSNACLGFLNAIVVAGSMIESGQIERALIVSGENAQPLLHATIDRLHKPDITRKSIKPYFANLTIGSGAVAAVLCHERLARKPFAKLIGGIVETDTSCNHLCEGDGNLDRMVMKTHSEQLLAAGIAVATRAWERFRNLMQWNLDAISRVITHQVGKAHNHQLYESLGIPGEKDFSSYAFLGNIGSVSLPITLALAAERGAVASGDNVALLGIGSGLSSLMLGIKIL